MTEMSASGMKRLCGYHAVDFFVTSGMTVGLGTGSTVAFSLDRLAEKIKSEELHDIRGIPTSKATESRALELGIPLIELHRAAKVDIAIDGADEVDSGFNLIKGRGGALLREKMVEECAQRFVVVVDESKIFPKGLGTGGPLPVEVNIYNWEHIASRIRKLESLSNLSSIDLRTEQDGTPFKTDNENYILNLHFDSPLQNVKQVAADLLAVTGVVEHGIFIDMASNVVVARSNGTVDVLSRPDK